MKRGFSVDHLSGSKTHLSDAISREVICITLTAKLFLFSPDSNYESSFLSIWDPATWCHQVASAQVGTQGFKGLNGLHFKLFFFPVSDHETPYLILEADNIVVS